MRIAGMEVSEAVEKIERWVNQVRLEWQDASQEEDQMLEEAWDDVKGGNLRVGDVRKARKEEVGYMKERGIWKVVPIDECWNKTGKRPIGTRWVDTNKGSEDNPDIRCRLVAQDFREKADKHREDLFAATPPIEAERLALSRAVTRSWKADGSIKVRKVMFIDAKKSQM